ncbi:MAG: alpha-glucosidase C-terminal domain-containing protein [Phycisphaerae bacterium]|nr:alpha-glucosidase C-terminal domain-containing protein [Phycisphaerae bacterium]
MLKCHCPSSLPARALVVLTAISLVGGVLADPWPPAKPLKREMKLDASALPRSVDVEAAADGLWRCTFRFKPGPEAKSVCLAGTFNGWNASATTMRGPRGDGFWLVSVDLRPGTHEYKFVVDGNNWRQDPLNPEAIDDTRGGNNSVLRLGQLGSDAAAEARMGDGKINVDGLEHRRELPLYFQPLAADRVLFRYRTLTHDVAELWVAIQNGEMVPMHVLRQRDLFTWYEAEVLLPKTCIKGKVTQINYTFVLKDGDETVSDPDTYSAAFTEQNVIRTPDWAKNAVWYQLMPDRFRNGDPKNDPPYVIPWTSDWFTAQDHEREREKNGETFYHWYVFDRNYGGDFAGVEEELPYLKKLGVNALYFMPVFRATSNHKYNTMNYVHVDPMFGAGPADDYDAIVATEDLTDASTWQWTKSDKRFLEFIKVAHAAGFKVIVDGVFNHVGREHPAFQDVIKNGEKSKYAAWFDITSWEPLKYECWGGFDSVPSFRKSATGLASNEAKEHIFAITRRWMDPNGDGDPSDGIDGWRLDVPNEIPAPFWEEWRQLVKSTNPDGYITGEIWDRAGQWLDGKHFDAVMNYEFAKTVISWVVDKERKITVSEFDRRLDDLRGAYPVVVTQVLQNLVDSHDTDRLVSMVANPDRNYDDRNRIQDSNPDYFNDKPDETCYTKARLIALIQMTYVGAPMIWYGDEAGMWGADDPTTRKPMLWEDLEPYEKPEINHVMKDHLAFYQRAATLRNNHPALRTGSFETLLTDDQADVWAFRRMDHDEQLIAVFNASDQPREATIKLPVDAPSVWKGVFGLDCSVKAADGSMSLKVPAVTGIVLHSPTPK